MKKAACFLLALCFSVLFTTDCLAVTFKIIQLTDNDTHDGYPSLYDGTIAWYGFDGNDNEIYYWDRFSILQVTNNDIDDVYPSLYNGTIAWVAWDGNDRHIYYWNGTSTTQIATFNCGDLCFDVVGRLSNHSDGVAWTGWDGNDWDIYYWDGTNTINVSDNTFCCDQYPSLSDGTIFWEGSDLSDREIYYWDGSNIIQITNNDVSDRQPSGYHGTVAWMGRPSGGAEILYWNGNTTIQVTDNTYYEDQPSLYNGTIAWRRDETGHGIDTDIFYWDGSNITQVMNNDFEAQRPSNHNGTIAWECSDGNDYEIYYAVPAPEPTITELVPSQGGYGTRIKVKGSGFGSLRSGMFNATQGYYSFVTFTDDSDTMIATKYPHPENPLWSDTKVVTLFMKLFIDTNGNYLQDYDESFLTGDQLSLGNYTIMVNTIWFQDNNTDGIYDAGDEVSDTFSSNSRVFNLTEDPVIYRLIPNPTLPSQPGNPQYVKIKGLNFGQPQGSSTLHIGGKTWSEGHPKIELWRDTKIKIKIPKYNCEWFGDQESRNKKIWVTVDGVDSNKKKLKIAKPATCP